MNTALAIIILLVAVIVVLIVFAVMQLSLAGIKVKDFWSFIEANQALDSLYNFSKEYEKMSQQEQIIFLQETEKMSEAFEKVPDMVWDDEYIKYREVMDAYRKLKVLRWEEENKHKESLKSKKANI